MSSNLNNNAPISVTQPNTVGKGRVDLVKSDFDAAIVQKGLEVTLEKALRCPCRRSSDRQPLSSCRNCAGSGWVFINKKQTRMIIQSMNVSTKFKEWSEENIGTIRITARDEENLAYMDRITIADSEVTFSQIIYPIIHERKVRAKTIYNIEAIEDIFAFEGSEKKLVKLELNADYTYVDNMLELNSKYSNWNDLTISIRYRHNPMFHVQDLVRENMSTKVQTAGGEQTVVMPISAVGRKAHYVLDEENYNGTYLFDNSYELGGCGNSTELAVDQPSRLTLTHPSSTSVILNWQDNSDDETNYVIHRAGVDGVFAQIAVVNPNITTYTDTVTASTTYFYRVAALKETKQSDWTDVVGITTNA